MQVIKDTEDTCCSQYGHDTGADLSFLKRSLQGMNIYIYLQSTHDKHFVLFPE